jgi:hypothetical protein
MYRAQREGSAPMFHIIVVCGRHTGAALIDISVDKYYRYHGMLRIRTCIWPPLLAETTEIACSDGNW